MTSEEQVSKVIEETIIAPAKSGSETRWLLFIITTLLVICAATIFMRTGGTKKNELEAYQINAFSEFSAPEMGVFNNLLTAALEIDSTHSHEDGYWMTVNELAAYLVPPFVKDAAWNKQGKIFWEQKLIKAEGHPIALYKGVPTNDDVGGTFLLLMLHKHLKKRGNTSTTAAHIPFEIWFHKTITQKFPDIITDQALIRAGWKEVVALTGEEEVTRTKGKSIK